MRVEAPGRARLHAEHFRDTPLLRPSPDRRRLSPEPGDALPAGTPAFDPAGTTQVDGRQLLVWLGERDQRGLAQLAALLAEQPRVSLPLLPEEPTDLPALAALGADLEERLKSQ